MLAGLGVLGAPDAGGALAVARGELLTVGADAGLIVTTESIAPASIDSATQVAISGRMAACPLIPRRRSGPNIRKIRCRRRWARSSRR